MQTPQSLLCEHTQGIDAKGRLELKFKPIYMLYIKAWAFNTFLASGYFCHLLIIFANSLDPDQDRQYVGPDLDPNC